MVKKSVILLVALAFSAPSFSSIVGIVDSGTDMKHEMIAPHAWINPGETPDNNRDEDGNGYQDDIYGWNFAEGNNQVIDYKYLGLLDDDIRKFFKIQENSFLRALTPEEIAWARAKLEDQEFIKKISTYANFMHGSHVAGIASRDSEESKILAIKLIPTEQGLSSLRKIAIKKFGADKIANAKYNKGFESIIVISMLQYLAEQQAKAMGEIAIYLNGHKADIANGSFGTGYAQAEMIVKAIFQGIMQREPTPEETKECALAFLDAVLKASQAMLTNAPNTLYVFAAGNDGNDNDVLPTSPTNLVGDNEISVAATFQDLSLAKFSNYGKKMVDVAAPGVNINSASPGDEYITISGTSQAAPYVSNVASLVKDANPSLTPGEIKRIIMGTVDIKSFLKGKVKTDGLVNRERAQRAGEYSATMPLAKAIEESFKDMPMLPDTLTKSMSNNLTEMKGLVLPLPSQFIVR